MPNCLSVEKKAFPLRQVRSENGALVPWEVRGYFEDYEAAKSPFGFFDLSHWEMLSMKGQDAADYLQRMSTADVRKLATGAVTYLAFLTGRANPVAFGYVWRQTSDTFLLWFPAGQGATAFEHIEKFHFAESFTLSPIADQMLTALWIPAQNRECLAALNSAGEPFRAVSGVIAGDIPVVYFKDDVRPELVWVTLKAEQLMPFWEALVAEGGHLVGHRLFEHFRLRAGLPEVGKEISEKEIFLEGNFEKGVARNKGCYPGQEVIERIFTYGQVNKKLLPLTLSTTGPFPAAPYALQAQDKPVGSLVAFSENPESLSTAVGLAYIGKAHWADSTPFVGPQGVVGTLQGPKA